MDKDFIFGSTENNIKVDGHRVNNMDRAILRTLKGLQRTVFGIKEISHNGSMMMNMLFHNMEIMIPVRSNMAVSKKVNFHQVQKVEFLVLLPWQLIVEVKK